MGPAPPRFRSNDQEQRMRTVANENNDANGSTNDPDPKFISSIENKVSMKENRVDIPGLKPIKFSLLILLKEF